MTMETLPVLVFFRLYL